MNWARQFKWKLYKAFLCRPLPRHYLQIKTKKMLDVVIYRLTPYVRVESLNKHDRSYLPGFGRSKTDHNRSSSTLISASNNVFSSSFHFTLVQLGKVPLQYHTQRLIKAIWESTTNQESNNSHTVLTGTSFGRNKWADLKGVHVKLVFDSGYFRRETMIRSYWMNK